MPFRILKLGDGYVVENTMTKRRHSHEPMTLENAKAQLRILNGVYAHEHSGKIKK
jgi:hypothetical protein